MTKEICKKCDNDSFYINSQSVNGGYTANTICTKCKNETELVDTYEDLN